MNLSIVDAISFGPRRCVFIRGVVLISEVDSYTNGTQETVLIREVSLFQRLYTKVYTNGTY